jgi:RNA polymerase sigma factor (sigma-70 family)
MAQPAGAGDATDGQLLDRFVLRHDDDAFTALVQRHGPMVLAVCRRVLHDSPDAEDAFQATFLVLVRKAASIGKPERLGNWLYGVAYRTALRARAPASRRRALERQAPGRPPANPGDEVVWRDLRPVLDEELNRLPAKYRGPVVLCYLEGKTQEEAARWLGCPRETVATRLARARARLQGRLTRRGLAPVAGELAIALTEGAAPAAVPAALAAAAVRAGLLAAAGKAVAGVVSGEIVALTEGVVHAMWMTKLKVATAAVLAVTVLGTSAGVVALRTAAGEQPTVKNESPAKPPAKEGAARDDVRVIAELAQARLKAAREVNEGLRQQFLAGRDGAESLLLWSPHLLEAELDVAANKAERLAALQAYVDRMKEYEKLTQRMFEAGHAVSTDLSKAKFLRLEAELRLAKEKAK